MACWENVGRGLTDGVSCRGVEARESGPFRTEASGELPPAGKLRGARSWKGGSEWGVRRRPGRRARNVGLPAAGEVCRRAFFFTEDRDVAEPPPEREACSRRTQGMEEKPD